MATAQFGRVITAMITPFTEDGAVDYESAVALAKHLVAHGSEGLLVGGTTGEGATMTAEEKLKLYTLIVDAVGKRGEGKKVPVMGNIGTISTADTIAFGNKAKETGIDCALVIVPFYVKPNQEGMYQHFTAVAKGVDLPLVLYNVPGRTGVSIQPETIKRVVDECPNVVGIKDATGNWDQVTKEKALLPEDFMIYSGDDAFTLPVLLAGGVGIISVSAHVIGDDMLAMVDAFEKAILKKPESCTSRCMRSTKACSSRQARLLSKRLRIWSASLVDISVCRWSNRLKQKRQRYVRCSKITAVCCKRAAS